MSEIRGMKRRIAAIATALAVGVVVSVSPHRVRDNDS